MKKLDLKTVDDFDAFIKSQKKLAFIMLSIEGCGWCDQQEKSNEIVEEQTGIKTFHLFLEAGSPLRDFIVSKFGFSKAPSTMIVQNKQLVLINDPRYDNTYLLNRFQDYEKLIKIANILMNYKHVKRPIYGVFHDACISCANYIPERKKLIFFKKPSRCILDVKTKVDPKFTCNQFNRAEAFKVYKI